MKLIVYKTHILYHIKKEFVEKKQILNTSKKIMFFKSFKSLIKKKSRYWRWVRNALYFVDFKRNHEPSFKKTILSGVRFLVFYMLLLCNINIKDNKTLFYIYKKKKKKTRKNCDKNFIMSGIDTSNSIPLLRKSRLNAAAPWHQIHERWKLFNMYLDYTIYQ